MSDNKFENGVVIAAPDEGTIFFGDEINGDCPRERNGKKEQSCHAKMPNFRPPAFFCAEKIECVKGGDDHIGLEHFNIEA